MPSSSELNDMLNAGVMGGLVACGGLMLFGMLGFVMVIGRGGGLWRALQFAIFSVMLGLAIPAACAVSTYVAYGATSSFMDSAVKSEGVVVGLAEKEMSEGGTGYSAIVEFTPQGRDTPIQVVDNSAVCDPACKKVGDRVTMIYNPDNPAGAKIDNVLTNWVWVLVFAIITLVLLLIALWSIAQAYRTRRYGLIFGELMDSIFS